MRKTKKYMLLVSILLISGLALSGLASNVSAPEAKNKPTLGKVLGLSLTPVPFKEAPSAYQLPSAKWIPQSFNNCGPAATAMTLQYFGYNVSQEETKAKLRTSSDDKNVFIGEISAYLKNDYGIQNKVLFNGDLKTLKTLVSNGVYVVVEDFLHPNEDIGHVLIIRGFDDTEGVLIADDSYFGVGIKYPYEMWDEGQWKPYNREFMSVYRADKEAIVKAIVGENWDEPTMYQNSVLRNLRETEANPNDMYAWFNLGTSYFGLGEYSQARTAFEKSKALGWPHRMLWYQIQPVQTYNKLGEYKLALETADLALWYNDSFGEIHYEKAVAYKGLGEIEKARIEAQAALGYNPDFTLAKDLLHGL